MLAQGSEAQEAHLQLGAFWHCEEISIGYICLPDNEMIFKGLNELSMIATAKNSSGFGGKNPLLTS
jgi:hypothetical protein